MTFLAQQFGCVCCWFDCWQDGGCCITYLCNLPVEDLLSLDSSCLSLSLICRNILIFCDSSFKFHRYNVFVLVLFIVEVVAFIFVVDCITSVVVNVIFELLYCHCSCGHSSCCCKCLSCKLKHPFSLTLCCSSANSLVDLARGL